MAEIGKRRSGQGYTLLEMAVVIALVGMLTGGMLMPISAWTELRARREAQQQIEEIRHALLGYALANGRLPCPAQPDSAAGEAGAGESPETCAGNQLEGVLPWVTLGVAETDPWGRRFTYRVTGRYADAIDAQTLGCTPSVPPAQASFALCSSGDMTIQSRSGTSVALQIPATVVSHGKNGRGGYLPTGERLPQSADADERKNSDATTTFVSDTSTQDYDDLTGWIPGALLLERMVAAGRLP